MKKMKLLAAALIILIAAASCSKSKNELPQPVPQPLEQSKEKKLISANYIYENDPTEIMELTYDAQGRLSLYNDGDHKYFFSFDAGSKLNVTRKNVSDGQTDQILECDLNEKGAITKMIYKRTDNTVFYMYEYSYDANGYLLKQKGSNMGSTPYSYEIEYTVVNGNPVSSKLSYDGVLSSNTVLTYDEKILNKAPFSASYMWPSDKLFGKPIKNILIGAKTFNTSNVLTWETKNTYMFDANNYPVKVTTTDILKGEAYVANYVYQ
jgi:hypothetical protein